MNITPHLVSPEEVMAFLDGELSAAEARTVSTHIEHCTDCAKILEQLQTTSHSLAEWKVDPVPMRLEKSVSDAIVKVDSGLKVRKPSLFIRASFWTWEQWAVASGGALAVLFLLFAISIPNLYRTRDYTTDQRIGASLETSKPITGQKSIASLGQRGRANMTVAPPGSTRDSNSDYGLVGRDKGAPGDRIADDQSDNSDQDYSYSPAPMIARTVSLSIMVKDFAASRSLLDTVIARHHGYFGQLNVSTPQNSARSLQASLRIPASELGAALADLKTIGRVENESQSGEEVTQQHADLVARLKTSRETEQRFRAILQQRTGKLSDVLKVEEEIARVRGDIEGMEAEQKELEHRVNFATVELHLTEEYRAQLNPPAASVSTRIYNGLVDGYHNAQETVLGIVIFFAENGPTLLIWLMILGLPAVFIWRRYRKTLAGI